MRQLISTDLRAHLPLSDIQALWKQFSELFQVSPEEQVYRLTECEIPRTSTVRTVFVSVDRSMEEAIATMQFGDEFHS